MVNPFLAAFAGGFLLFSSAASPRKAEKKFEGALRQYFPAATIDVTIKGKRGFDVINGKFRSVRVDMRDFQIGPADAAAAPANALPEKTSPQNTLPGNELLAAPSGSTPSDTAPIGAASGGAAPTGPSLAGASTLPPKPAVPTTPPMMAIMTTAAPKDRGHVGHTEIALKEFGLGPLHVTSLDASFEDVTYDWKELKNGRALAIEKAGPAKATVVLPAASLDTLVRTRLKSFQNPRLTLKDGRVHIAGTRAAPIVGTQLPVVFTARPAARGNEIRFEDTTLSIGGAPVPAMVARTLIGDINPVFSFDRDGVWPYRVELTGATVGDGSLSLSADLKFVPAAGSTVGK